MDLWNDVPLCEERIRQFLANMDNEDLPPGSEASFCSSGYDNEENENADEIRALDNVLDELGEAVQINYENDSTFVDPVDNITLEADENLHEADNEPNIDNNEPVIEQVPNPFPQQLHNNDELPQQPNQVQNPRQRRPVIWGSAVENDHYLNPPEFNGRFNVNINGDTPYKFFTYFFSEDLIDKIVFESNRYAIQSGKHNFSLSKNELNTFLAQNIIMTYIRYPKLRMYWSSIKGLRMDMIANAMPVNRFEEIKRYLHFTNNENAPKGPLCDRYWKLRDIIDHINGKFALAVDPDEHQAVDEMLVPFKGRNILKQYLRGKPKKWGFKVWSRASREGYVHVLEFYQGKRNEPRTELGVIGDVVMRLCENIKGSGHKLFVDNLFTTLPLIRKLRESNIYVLGTVRLNRLPGVASKLVPGKNLPRGGCTLATSSDNITVVRWMDKREVHLISSYAGAEPMDETERWDRKERKVIKIARPNAVRLYNLYMGGVDIADRMLAHYPHGFKNRRWYLRVFFFLLNLSITNAWLCYRKKIDSKMPLLDFKASVAGTMIALAQSTQKRRGRPSLSPEEPIKKKRPPTIQLLKELRFDGIHHYPKKLDASNQARRCHDKNCKKRTRFLCGKCDIPICPECMENFHLQSE